MNITESRQNGLYGVPELFSRNYTLKMETFNITPIENEGKRVLTTAQLAEAYETDSKVISKNFNRNSDRYTEGKHFYRLTGDELKEFKTNRQIDESLIRINVLYLWTEKGALLHAKTLLYSNGGQISKKI